MSPETKALIEGAYREGFRDGVMYVCVETEDFTLQDDEINEETDAHWALSDIASTIEAAKSAEGEHGSNAAGSDS